MEEHEYARMFDFENRYWWFRGRRFLVRHLLSRYRLWLDRDRVLDVGCGTGATLQELSTFGAAVGLDSSRDALAFCRRRGDLPLVRAEAGSLPFHDESFEAVVALDLLEHVEDDREVLGEILRVVRPGGFLLITVPAFQFLWSRHDEALHHRRRYRSGDLSEKVEGVGFEILKISYAVSILFPLIALHRLAERVVSVKSTPETTLTPVPAALNELLYQVLRLEAFWIGAARFPAGVSLVCVARKSGGEEE